MGASKMFARRKSTLRVPGDTLKDFNPTMNVGYAILDHCESADCADRVFTRSFFSLAAHPVKHVEGG